MTLLNPTGCDLTSYEQKLVRQKSLYALKMDQLVWSALPDTVQQPLREEWGLGGGDTPSYQQHRQQLHSALAAVGWPVEEEELALLEEEIALADSFLRWATSWAMVWSVVMFLGSTSACRNQCSILSDIPELCVRRELLLSLSMALLPLSQNNQLLSAHR